MSDNTDVAALAAGVVAVALTLLVILIGYVMHEGRHPLQRVALAAVTALLLLPIAGYPFDGLFRALGATSARNDVGGEQSVVLNWLIFLAWLGAYWAIAWLDVNRPPVVHSLNHFYERLIFRHLLGRKDDGLSAPNLDVAASA
ncbi:hypothetical protein ELH48_13835 [Rhizobium ruizarguesonis]|uniref:hypothetical protein n=1 Tax=Rhizobium ruizarguesonis TaxID=2081791 RepID=UPI00102F3AA6|nr:hypothetical protein [Rhizobium ruizarguesonis]TBB28158.1 hypothetical protein ELH48_13835 [Rhizobium ruizarguesonis]TBB49775.1 hypothetical protein ELH46_13830 [Rhizobium ruizarguesonis]